MDDEAEEGTFDVNTVKGVVTKVRHAALPRCAATLLHKQQCWAAPPTCLCSSALLQLCSCAAVQLAAAFTGTGTAAVRVRSATAGFCCTARRNAVVLRCPLCASCRFATTA